MKMYRRFCFFFLVIFGAASSEAEIHSMATGTKPVAERPAPPASAAGRQVERNRPEAAPRTTTTTGLLQWTPAVRGTNPHVRGGFRDLDDFLAFTGEPKFSSWLDTVAGVHDLNAEDRDMVANGTNAVEVTVFPGSVVRNMTTATNVVGAAVVANAPAKALLFRLSRRDLVVFMDCGNTAAVSATFSYGAAGWRSAITRREPMVAEPETRVEREPAPATIEREREVTRDYHDRDYRSERDSRVEHTERVIVEREATPAGPTAEEVELQRIRLERERLALRREQLEAQTTAQAQLERERKDFEKYQKSVRKREGGGGHGLGHDLLMIGLGVGLDEGASALFGRRSKRTVYRDRPMSPDQQWYRPIRIEDNRDLPIHIGDPGTPGSPYAPPLQDGRAIPPDYQGSGLDPHPPGYVPPSR